MTQSAEYLASRRLLSRPFFIFFCLTSGEKEQRLKYVTRPFFRAELLKPGLRIRARQTSAKPRVERFGYVRAGFHANTPPNKKKRSLVLLCGGTDDFQRSLPPAKQNQQNHPESLCAALVADTKNPLTKRTNIPVAHVAFGSALCWSFAVFRLPLILLTREAQRHNRLGALCTFVGISPSLHAKTNSKRCHLRLCDARACAAP